MLGKERPSVCVSVCVCVCVCGHGMRVLSQFVLLVVQCRSSSDTICTSQRKCPQCCPLVVIRFLQIVVLSSRMIAPLLKFLAGVGHKSELINKSPGRQHFV